MGKELLSSSSTVTPESHAANEADPREGFSRFRLDVGDFVTCTESVGLLRLQVNSAVAWPFSPHEGHTASAQASSVNVSCITCDDVFARGVILTTRASRRSNALCQHVT